jgi:hypothetical protein
MPVQLSIATIHDLDKKSKMPALLPAISQIARTFFQKWNADPAAELREMRESGCFACN